MSKPRGVALRANDLDVVVADRTLVNALSLELAHGELVALLGKNGAGKTLLLHTLAGLRPAASGSLEVLDADFATLSRRDLAKALVLLPQDNDDVFPASVLETVLIGRHPHVGRFGWETERDIEASRAALAAIGLEALADRDVLSLSGGERRRVALAQCLTQDSPVMLLDEPTNHLDPHHQVETLELCRSLADGGKAVLMSLHDINFAARYADRCLILFGNGEWRLGATDTMLQADILEALYDVAMDSVSWNGRQLYVPTIRPRNR